MYVCIYNRFFRGRQRERERERFPDHGGLVAKVVPLLLETSGRSWENHGKIMVNDGILMDNESNWLVGLNPSENMKVNWDDEIPNIWENKIDVPNHQPQKKNCCFAIPSILWTVERLCWQLEKAEVSDMAGLDLATPNVHWGFRSP